MNNRPARLVLIGHPVRHSLSPRMQTVALERARLEVAYEALDVSPRELPDVLARLAAGNVAGNVTIPHKEAVAAASSRLTPLAERVGAVNTFWTEAGALVGDNTDVGGFEHAARSLLGREPAGLTIGVFGAGGAAGAVLAAVERWGQCRALVANRTPNRADDLCARFRSVAQRSDAAEIARRADLVVNATSLGLRDDNMPIDPQILEGGAYVLDLVYRPGETRWVREARAAGHPALDGLTMLVEQGALAFERWFGHAPDREAMWEAVL